MIRTEALELLADDGYEPDSYEEAAEIFTALYGRKPDAEDGDQCQVWSHCCAWTPDADADDPDTIRGDHEYDLRKDDRLMGRE